MAPPEVVSHTPFPRVPGSVAVEQATVYRGGRRRWFSLRAACRAEAQMVVTNHLRARLPDECTCREEVDHAIGYTPPECPVHAGARRWRLVDRVARLIEKAHKP